MTQPTTKKWQKIKIFNTYEQADQLRNELKNDPENENLEIKIRRCGPRGTQFKVKTSRPSTQNKK